MINNFRYDINFLRMVAVMSVVINHISPTKLAGGYLGVDMFFVISAYLISSLLLKEYIANGKISLFAFYRRRIFRIAPVLSVVLVFTLISSWALFYYDVLEKISLSSIFSSMGFANIYFWKFLKLDYFNPTADIEPLLHIWSLGVEEQFYFLFPLSLLLLWRFKKIFTCLLVLLFVASLILAIEIDDYNFVYYNLPTRLFELIAGVLSSFYVHSLSSKSNNNEARKDLQTLIISLLSLSIIVLSLFLISDKYYIPNHYSLIIVLPTVFILVNGAGNKELWLEKFYRFKVFQLVGLWSYSIYLWHWVLLVLFKTIYGLDLPPHINYIALLGSVGIGALSYYLIEEKTRYLKWSIKKGLLIFILLPLSLSASLYYYSKIMDKTMEDYKPQSIIDTKGAYSRYNGKMIYTSTFSQDIYQKLLPINSKGKKSNMILAGDSYARQNILFIDQIANFLKISYDVRTISGVGSILLKDRNVKSNDNARHYQTKFANTTLLNYDVIVLSSLYNENNIDDVDSTIKELARLGKVIILLPVIPILTTFDISSIIKPFTFLNNNKFNVKDYNDRILPINSKLKEISRQYPNTYYLDYNVFLFDDNNDLIYKDGRNSLFYNKNHLSSYGSIWLARKYIDKGLDDFWYNVANKYHAKYGIESN